MGFMDTRTRDCASLHTLAMFSKLKAELKAGAMSRDDVQQKLAPLRNVAFRCYEIRRYSVRLYSRGARSQAPFSKLRVLLKPASNRLL